MTRSFWPRDLATALQDALDSAQQLTFLVEREAHEDMRDVVEQLSETIGAVLLLPKLSRSPLAPLGSDYIDVVRGHLAVRADRLLCEARGIAHFMEEEVRPRIAEGGSCASGDLLGAIEVVQDLANDLDQAHQNAVSLARAVREVETASNDFCGADLRQTTLEGTLLEGVRWDAQTTWPDEWEERIRRASLPAGEGGGVLIVGAEPHDSAVGADA